MDGKRLIRSIKLTNLLSFGPKGEQIELEPLNVLIGPNASGKSNFIEAIGLLHALPQDLAAAARRGGGASEWMWKGEGASGFLSVKAVVNTVAVGLMRYDLCLEEARHRFAVLSEFIEPGDDDAVDRPEFFYVDHPGELKIRVSAKKHVAERRTSLDSWDERLVARDKLDSSQSVLSQLKDPEAYPAIADLGAHFSAIRLYREWDLGPDTVPRKPQATDLPSDLLEEDASNLWMVLKELENRPETWARVTKRLKSFHSRIQRISFRILVNTAQMLLHERGLGTPIPATRLSDGTLRFLCLLAILCHPEPPPLVVIEEPELGLHPDALGLVAELLLEASQRMQLIVTTHSDALVSELSGVPESVLVCERDDEGSHLRRLDKDRLKEWLEEYMLGDLWRMGKIGGNP